MILNPEKVWEEFENNRIDKLTAFELLNALIENSNDEDIRIKAIKI